MRTKRIKPRGIFDNATASVNIFFCGPGQIWHTAAVNWALVDDVRKLPLKVSDIYRRLTL